MADLAAGGAMGVPFTMLCEVIKEVGIKTFLFRPLLEELKSKIEALNPLIDPMDSWNKVLDRPEKELRQFKVQMEKGPELITKCANLSKWKTYKKYKYSNQLLELQNSLQNLLFILQLQQARDVKETLVVAKNVETVVQRVDVSVAEFKEEGMSVMKETLDEVRNIGTVVRRIDRKGEVLSHGGWIQECGGVSLPYLAMPSESDHSASDSDGQGTILIHPSSQTQIVIVEDSCGSDPNPTQSPFHSTGSHDYNYVESHQASGHCDSRLEQGLVTPGIDANIVANRPPHGTDTTSVWVFSATGFAFEAVSAFFDQVSTPRKSQYSLYGMLLSIVAVLVCIVDLIHNALIQKERIQSASHILWGILPEIFGLALACIQCMSSVLQFSFLCRHAANPMKISLVPFLFFFVLFAFKYRGGRNRG